ncbi:MAG: glycerate kinase, partial [Acidobacteriota bacterium]|nr:glycerate kinase [Acidobacteriota bacterium]
MPDLEELRRHAREIFGDVLEAVDAERAVLGAVGVEGARLRVCDAEFDLRALNVYSVALGKAAAAMASALDERLGERLVGGVISTPPSNYRLSRRWLAFDGGHPLPNAASVEAARAAFNLLREADDPSALVIFLVSGGGSAMLEWPRDPRVTLEDLRAANRRLVSCGAGIEEINSVRRALSAVKGGGLSRLAPRAAQLTLVISDVAAGRVYDVASGPTLTPPADAPDPREVVERHGLASKLPASILQAIEAFGEEGRRESFGEEGRRAARAASSNDLPRAESAEAPAEGTPSTPARRHYVLLDNARACAAAAESARARGFAVETAQDISEQSVGEGASALVSRLAELQRREGARGVCLVSGGEFACPVRGKGLGGRSSETALRCAFEFEKMLSSEVAGRTTRAAVALCAGTDGVDGNSPAAGALADHLT